MSEKRKLGWLKYGEHYYAYGDKNKTTSGRGGTRFWCALGRVEKGRGYYSGYYARRAVFNGLFETTYSPTFQGAREWVVEGVRVYYALMEAELERKRKENIRRQERRRKNAKQRKAGPKRRGAQRGHSKRVGKRHK